MGFITEELPHSLGEPELIIDPPRKPRRRSCNENRDTRGFSNSPGQIPDMASRDIGDDRKAPRPPGHFGDMPQDLPLLGTSARHRAFLAGPWILSNQHVQPPDAKKAGEIGFEIGALVAAKNQHIIAVS